MMKRKTHDEYVTELAIKNPNVEVVGKYIDYKTKIPHKCKIHNFQWLLAPNGALNGNGCELCAKEARTQKFLKTHEQYVEELKSLNPNIIVLEQYVGANTSILHKCSIHNTEWMAQPTNILQGKGCPDCANDARAKNNGITREEYINRLFIENPTVEIIGEYINARTKTLHHCLIHDIYWEIRPDSALNKKSGCPQCKIERFSVTKTKTRDEYINQLSTKNPTIELVGDYLGDRIHTQHYCRIHDFLFDALPNSMLQGHGCKYCRSERISKNERKSHEQYEKELKEVNPNIVVLETYTYALTPILHKCLIDGYEWCATPANILSGTGCPKCQISKGEKQICKWLDNHSIIYEQQKRFVDCRDILPLPFDFYLPYKNMAIEFDGKQHFESFEYFGGQEGFEIRQKHDNIKNEYCKNNGIPLLRIPYDKNIEEELNNFLFN